MPHRIAQRKLGRSSGHRRLLWRTMATQLIMHERIETTLPKAKELRGFADRLITWGKQGDQSARRRAQGMLFDESAVHKLFTVMADRYKDRAGGYTRIMRTRIRQGDVAQMAYIEYVDRQGELRPALPGRPGQPSYSMLPAIARAAAVS